MIIQPEYMGYSNLVELYGSEMGRSLLRRVASKAKKAVKVVARNPAAIATGGASLLAPKSLQRKLNKVAAPVLKYSTAAATGGASLLATKSGRNLLNKAAAVSTGGLSLLATKSGRNTLSKVARVTQKTVLRPVAKQAMKVARNPMVQKLAATAARAGAAYVTGGASEAALKAASMARSNLNKAKQTLTRAVPTGILQPSPLRTPQRSAAGIPSIQSPVTSRRRRAPAPAASAAPVETVEKKGLPIVPIAIGGAGLLALALFMGSKKKG